MFYISWVKKNVGNQLDSSELKVARSCKLERFLSDLVSVSKDHYTPLSPPKTGSTHNIVDYVVVEDENGKFIFNFSTKSSSFERGEFLTSFNLNDNSTSYVLLYDIEEGNQSRNRNLEHLKTKW